MMRKRASETPYVDWSLDLIGGQLLTYQVRVVRDNVALALAQH